MRECDRGLVRGPLSVLEAFPRRIRRSTQRRFPSWRSRTTEIIDVRNIFTTTGQERRRHTGRSHRPKLEGAGTGESDESGEAGKRRSDRSKGSVGGLAFFGFRESERIVFRVAPCVYTLLLRYPHLSLPASLPFPAFLSLFHSHSHSSDSISAIRFLHGGSILRAYSAPHCATYLIYRFLFFRTPCRLLRTNVRGHKPQGGSFGYVALYDFNPRIVNRSLLIYVPRPARM